jgi:hypothetical protein
MKVKKKPDNGLSSVPVAAASSLNYEIADALCPTEMDASETVKSTGIKLQVYCTVYRLLVLSRQNV